MKLDTLEVRRQLFHICFGLVLLFLIANGILTSLHLLILLLLGGALSVLTRKFRLRPVYAILRFFEREHHLQKFPGKGVISFVTGTLLVLQLFPRDIAFASIMILTFGDSLSHFFGRHFGRVRNPLNGVKSVEGNIIGGLAGFLAALSFVNPVHAFLASFGAMAVEAVELKMNDQIVDDNIIVPLAAGTILYVIRLYL